MPRTFFTSDPHYGHKNIVEALSTWEDKWGCRKGFQTIEEMNDELVRGINAVVRPDDVLYCLGDWNFGGIRNQREFRSRVACESVHLILGNHDFNHNSIDPATVDHGFASVGPYKEIVVEGQEIILFHYGQRVWNRQGKGSWHLYGHSHGMLDGIPNFSLDVGVDAHPGQGLQLHPALNVFNPVPWEFGEIKDFFCLRGDTIACEDSHGRSDENSRPITVERARQNAAEIIGHATNLP